MTKKVNVYLQNTTRVRGYTNEETKVDEYEETGRKEQGADSAADMV